ncbi:MAG: CoA transferase [Alphaproteobacteria bacterium]
MPGVLEGLRIIEHSAFVAAPSAGLTLAQLGAEVIRVDPIGGALDAGRWPLNADGVSLYWTSLNRGKRSVVLDLRRPEGRDLLARLILEGDDAGIYLTNLPAPVGLEYAELQSRREDVIVVRLTGNPDGSAAVDYTVNCATGLPWLTGPADMRAPVNHVLPAWDLLAGASLVNAVLAAERQRRLTGAGQEVRLALADVALGAIANLGLLAEAEHAVEPRRRSGNDLYGSFGRDFATSDGRRVMIVALTRRHWRALVELAGITEQVAKLEAMLDMDLSDEGNRYRATDQIAALIAPWCAHQSFAELSEKLEAAGILWGPYRTVRQLLDEDWRASPANPMFQHIEQPGVGQVLAARSALDFIGQERPPAAAAQPAGADTAAVLGEVLGLSGDELAMLASEGVIPT